MQIDVVPKLTSIPILGHCFNTTDKNTRQNLKSRKNLKKLNYLSQTQLPSSENGPELMNCLASRKLQSNVKESKVMLQKT